MINDLLNFFSGIALNFIDNLPEVKTFIVPDGVYSGIDNIFSFVGWLMPYELYAPLILFILSLTAFRISYAFYLHFKK